MSKARKKMKKSKKLLLIVLAELVVLVLLIVGYAFYYINSKTDSMQFDETPKEEIEVSESVTDEMKGYTTIALFGLDTRDNADMTKKGVAHGDAVIIASINNDTKEVKLVSVYRDAFLEIATNSPSTQKYTHAYFLGGPTCAVETLNRNLDLNITQYVSVDFAALTKAIDALGGVTINVKEKELNNLNKNLQEQIEVTGISSDGVWSAGEQTLNGSQATAYARIRKVGNGDFERTQRQRKVLSAMVDKAKKSDLATLNKVIDEVFPLVATNITNKEMLSFATDLLQYNLGENTGFPLANQTPTLGDKGSVVVPCDLLHNVQALHEFLYPDDKEYTPSEDVQRISANITAETGYGNEFSEEESTEQPTSTNGAE